MNKIDGLIAVVLAAGASSRMGFPKPLLRIGGKYFGDIVIQKIQKSGIKNILLVLGAKAEEIQKKLNTEGINIVINEEWESGQLSSLKKAIDGLVRENDAIMVCLVDQPLITQKTFDGMSDSYKKDNSNADIILPIYNGKRGHPVIFRRSVFDALLDIPLNEGARAVVNNTDYEKMQVEVDDPGIRRDIDTPEEYEKISDERI
jgi:molybdenum cofactor cytidylyltransferase